MLQSSPKQVLRREKLISLHAQFLVLKEKNISHRECLKKVREDLLQVEYFREAPRGPLERFRKREIKQCCLDYLGIFAQFPSNPFQFLMNSLIVESSDRMLKYTEDDIKDGLYTYEKRYKKEQRMSTTLF
jgi:hypothetical protein